MWIMLIVLSSVWNIFQIMKYYIMKIFSVICILASQLHCYRCRPIGPQLGGSSVPSHGMSHKRQLYKNVYIAHTDQDNHSNSFLKYVAIIPLNALPIWGVLLQGLREYSLKSKNDSPVSPLIIPTQNSNINLHCKTAL